MKAKLYFFTILGVTVFASCLFSLSVQAISAPNITEVPIKSHELQYKKLPGIFQSFTPISNEKALELQKVILDKKMTFNEAMTFLVRKMNIVIDDPSKFKSVDIKIVKEIIARSVLDSALILESPEASFSPFVKFHKNYFYLLYPNNNSYALYPMVNVKSQLLAFGNMYPILYFFRDDKRVYTLQNGLLYQMLGIDLKTLEDLNTMYAGVFSFSKDKKQVYYYDKEKNNLLVLENADPATFVVLHDQYFTLAKDKNFIYAGKTKLSKIEGVDIASFEIVPAGDIFFARDKNHVYYIDKNWKIKLLKTDAPGKFSARQSEKTIFGTDGKNYWSYSLETRELKKLSKKDAIKFLY